MNYKRRLSIALILALVLFSAACSDAALTKLSQALVDTALAMGTLQTTVIEANKQNLISERDTATILLLCLKVNAAGKEATALTRNLTKLSVADRSNVLAVLKPVIQAVNDTVASNALQSGNADIRAKILAGLQTIQLALNSAQLILAGGK